MKNLMGSFSTRLYLYILLLAAVLFGAIASVEYYYDSRREYQQASDYTLLLLKGIIKNMELQTSEASRNLNIFVPRVMSHVNSPDSVTQIVREMVLADTNTIGGCVAFVPDFYEQKKKFFMTYVKLDSVGHVSTKVLGSDTYDYTQKDWFKDALTTPEGIWIEPFMDTGGSDAYVTTYSMPLRDLNDSVFAVMSIDMSFVEFLNDLEIQRPYPESFIFILSGDGTYLSHADTTLINKTDIFHRADQVNSEGLALVGRRMLNGDSGSQLVDYDGRKSLVCYAPLPGVGWSVACVTPYDVVTKRLGMSSWLTVVIMLVGLVLLALCIRLVLNYTTRPLEQLIDASHHIAEGDFSYPLPTGKSNDDLGKLRNAFCEMQSSLKTYIAELTEITQMREREQSMVDITKTIRDGMLPQAFPLYPTRPEADIYGRMLTGRDASATLYDYHTTKDHLFFILADVNGSGIMSSLIMVVTVSMFRSSVIQTDSPARIISAINSLVAHNHATTLSENVFVGALDLTNGELSYCNAGHKWPVLCRADGTISVISGREHLPAGQDATAQYINETIMLNPGDVVVGFNDHVEELTDHLDHQLGYEGICKTISRLLPHNNNVSLQKLVNGICNTLNDFLENEQPDDDLAVMAMAFRQTMGTEGTIRDTIMLTGEMSEIPRLSIFINRVSKEAGWEPTLTHKINLVLEEGLSNIISYAYPEGFDGTKPKGSISLTVLGTQSSVSIRLIDDGKPYDPTAEVRRAERDTPEGLPSNKRALGYFLVHEIMDEVEYCRVDNHNQVVMRIYR